MLYQRSGESGRGSCPLCPGAATPLRWCPKALPSCHQLETGGRGCSGWMGAAGKGCITPAQLCKTASSSAFSCLWPASRAAFPFGFGGHLLVPRQQGEDLVLAGMQAVLISPSLSGSSSRFPDLHQNARLQQSRPSEHPSLLGVAGMAKTCCQALPDCFPIPSPAKRC